MADACYQSQPLYRKRTLCARQNQTSSDNESNTCRRYRSEDGRIKKRHISRHLSIATAIILGTALLFDPLEQTQYATAFTATSIHRNCHPTIHQTFTMFSTTAGNAEMEYRQRSNSSNGGSNMNDSKDESDIFTKSWKEVPGGFVPQFGDNHKLNTQNNNIPVTPSTKTINAVSQNVTPNPPPSTQSPSVSSSKSSSPSPMKKNTTPTTMRIRQLSNIKDYKHYVVDDVDPNKVTITVVRFYAPWCRACQAIQQRYYRLAQQYEQRMQLLPPSPREEETTYSPSPLDVVVRFMECPVTKDNAILHQGLGVPSLPYGHIYHSQVGLVEEMKLNKNVFTNFESILASYVNGYCTVTYNNNDEDDDVARLTENNIVSSNDTVDASTPSPFG